MQMTVLCFICLSFIIFQRNSVFNFLLHCHLKLIKSHSKSFEYPAFDLRGKKKKADWKYKGEVFEHRYFCFCDKVPAVERQLASEDKQRQSAMSTQQPKMRLGICRHTCGTCSSGTPRAHGRLSFSR